MSRPSFLDRITYQGTIKAVHYQWFVVALAFCGQFAESLGPQGLPVLYPFIQTEFGLSRAQVGLITSSYGIGGLVTVLLGGWLTDKLGVKRVAVITLVCLAAIVASFQLISSLPLIMILVAFVGITSAPLYPSTSRAIMDWIPLRIRGLAMSLKQTGVPAAGATAAALLPLLALALGWRTAAAIMGGLIFLVAILFIALYRDAPRSRVTMPKFNFATFRTLLHNRSLMATATWGALFVGLQYTVVTYLVLFLIEGLHTSPIIAGGILAIAQVSSVIARVSWGAVSDFLLGGRRKAVLGIIGLLTAVILFSISLLGAGVTRVMVVLLAMAIGASCISFHGVYTVLVGEAVEKENIATAIGIASSMNRVGTILVPPLFGHLVDITGSYPLAWRVAALAAFLMTIALLFFGREPQRR